MFNSKCAYCGTELKKGWHVDHVKPIYRGLPDSYRKKRTDIVGTDTEDNMFPSCPRCNRWKSVFTVEIFRREISKQIERLRKTNPGFRLAEDYGLIDAKENIKPKDIIFHFERFKK